MIGVLALSQLPKAVKRYLINLDRVSRGTKVVKEQHSGMCFQGERQFYAFTYNTYSVVVYFVSSSLSNLDQGLLAFMHSFWLCLFPGML